MRILVTGITGSIGGALTPRLLRDGHTVRGLSRRTARELGSAGPPAEVELLQGDILAGEGVQDALAGTDLAYYLIHSMETAPDGELTARELTAAANFASAAAAAGAPRVIYLGGLVADESSTSTHLHSRLEVERLLLSALPRSTAFRSSIVIGARSRSFRLLVRLVERMPALLLPAWHERRTAPVDERDVIECLARAATAEFLEGRSLDISGPDTITYGALIERIRDLLLIDRPIINLPHLTLTPIASRLVSVIADEDHALVGPLMEGLATDLLPREPDATELLTIRRHTLDAAIEHALRTWEATEPLSAR